MFKNINPMEKMSTILIWLLSIICTFLTIKTSNIPLLSVFNDSFFKSWFMKFEVGNEIILNLSIGFLVSVIFYLLVVWMPYKKKRHLIKNNYKKQYIEFKKGMIIIFLSASNRAWNSELLERLQNQSSFKVFFKEKVSNSEDRWHAILNGLDDYQLKNLTMELELFLNETNYVRNNIEFRDKNVFVFFNELERSVYRIKNSSCEYDNIRLVSKFIWQIFAGWSLLDGYSESDIIHEMIESI